MVNIESLAGQPVAFSFLTYQKLIESSWK